MGTRAVTQRDAPLSLAAAAYIGARVDVAPSVSFARGPMALALLIIGLFALVHLVC
jgi:hypothetical protein